MKNVTATLTKVLHSYGDIEVQETMRFVDAEHAAQYRKSMLNKRVKPYAGTSYTITKVEF